MLIRDFPVTLPATYVYKETGRFAYKSFRLQVDSPTLTSIQRKKYRSVQAQVFNLWDDYSSQRKNAEQLLRQCAHLNGPKRSR